MRHPLSSLRRPSISRMRPNGRISSPAFSTTPPTVRTSYSMVEMPTKSALCCSTFSASTTTRGPLPAVPKSTTVWLTYSPTTIAKCPSSICGWFTVVATQLHGNTICRPTTFPSGCTRDSASTRAFWSWQAECRWPAARLCCKVCCAVTNEHCSSNSTSVTSQQRGMASKRANLWN